MMGYWYTVGVIIVMLIIGYICFKAAESRLRAVAAGISTNYLQLKTIYNQRKGHRLPEWQTFCQWIETLPYSEWSVC